MIRTRKSWVAMRQRCRNPNAPDYPHYGGKGITICPEWETLAGFIADMGKRPENMTLDRIDPTGNYCKDNCRWADPSTQRNNQVMQLAARVDSSTGIRGVSRESFGNRFKSEAKRHGIRQVLYRGPDFFEACCARKSWEASVLRSV